MFKNKYFSVAFIFLILGMTLLRENLLLEINACILEKNIGREVHYWFYDFFAEKDPSELVFWKWGVTAFFCVMIPIFTLLSLYLWFGDFAMIKWMGKLYLFLVLGIFFLVFLGMSCYILDQIYPIVRQLIGLIQSPIPFFAFFVLIYAQKRQESTIS